MATRIVRSASRSGFLGTALAVLLGAGVPMTASAQHADSMFTPVRSEVVIAEQMRMALPQAVRGFNLLAAGADSEHTEAGVQALYNSYRLLRAAQQGSEMVYNYARFPDPMLKFRMDRLWEVRVSLLKCVDNKGHLSDAADPIRVQCLEGLPVGIHRLKVLVGTLP